MSSCLKRLKILLLAFTLSVLCFSVALAEDAPSHAGSGLVAANRITQAIEKLGDRVVALGFASMSTFNRGLYQFDKNLLSILQINAAGIAVDQDLKNTAIQTHEYIQNTLSHIPNAFLSTAVGAVNANQISKAIKEQNRKVNDLTLGVPGSDTLYLNTPSAVYEGYDAFTPNIPHYYNTNVNYTIGPPPLNDDSYFNAMSILYPIVYNKAELEAANAYVDYLVQSYKNPTSTLKLSSLKGYINSLKPAQQPAALYKFVSSAQYQNYQLQLRSYIANKSIVVSNLRYLMTERIPSQSKVEGIYDHQGHAVSHPSPLQVENYRANHRIQDAHWIENLQRMSSANLQREIAVELADIIRQNQQAHLDRERLLVTLSAMQLQTSQAREMMLNTLGQQVNDEISKLSGHDKAGTVNTH